MGDKLTAIVTDVKYRMSLAIIRDLGAVGIRVVACHRDEQGSSPPLGFYSKYTSKRSLLPSEEYDDALYELCKTISEEEGQRPALLPVGASTLAMLSKSESRERFSKVCGLFIPTSEQLALLNDKGHVAELASRLDVPIPKAYIPAEGETIDSLIKRIPLPCIVKPRWGEGLGLTAAQRYTIARTSDELKASYERFSSLAGEAPIIQEYLPGAARACSVLAQNGKIVSSICHRRIREYPVTGGPSTCCISSSDPLLEDLSSRLAGAIDLNGIAMFEFKDDADGMPRLLESNPRIWGSYPLTRIAKTGFSSAWFTLSWNSGNPTEPLPIQVETKYIIRKMTFFPSDLAAALGYLRTGKPRLTLGAAADLLNPGTKDGLFEWSDAKPALHYWRSLTRTSRNS